MRVLVLNAGSSSLKASVVDPDRREALASVAVGWGSDASRSAERAGAVEHVLAAVRWHGVDLESLGAVGHRVVHGGTEFRTATLVDDAASSQLESLTALAPLHNGVAVDVLGAARRLLPDLPHVAAFDTAFHATLEPDAFAYPLPWSWHEEWGIRRYGFHGLSVAWAVRRAGELLAQAPTELSIVVAHLGSGCSVTAVDGGRAVATSMGFTPLEGLMMGTRPGSIDPGIMLRLLLDERLDARELEESLNHASGLLGLSGVSGDVREVSAAADAGHERAALALDVFVRRAAEGIAAAATSLSRLEAVVFTGGIGENAARLRARIAGRLSVIGVSPIGDAPTDVDSHLSVPGAQVAVLRVEAREDLVIADEVRRVVG